MFSQEKTGHGMEPDVSVSACLAHLGDLLPRFVPGPAMSDRAFWQSISSESRSRLIAAGETALKADWPSLTASAYRAYCETGDRATFEAVYFERRRRLNDLALAELAEVEGRFLDALVDGLILVMEESGWQLPAHNSHERGGKRLPLPDPERPVVDLFAAETAAQLAVIRFVLGDALNTLSPIIVDRIDREIEKRVIRPYLTQHFWWMGNGDEPMNNWTAWCTQNVLLCTFSLPSDQSVRSAVIRKAAKSLDAFLKDYGEDGACEEGAFYYRHAALCLYGALTVMDQVAPGCFDGLWSAPKLRNMAEFILHTHVDGDHYINFADASAVLEPCGAREFLFGKQVGSDRLCTLAAEHVLRNPQPELPGEISLFYRLLALATRQEIDEFRGTTGKTPDHFYPSCGLFIARDERFVVAAKAGDNDDGHNHNDVGSVTIYKSGQPLLIDVGVETYTSKTFSPDRYEIWTMQSGYHNLPSFEGLDQVAGASFAARDISVELGHEVSSISMEIADAYPPEARLSSYRRLVRLLKGRGVEIRDEHAGELSATLSLMTRERPVAAGTGLKIGNLGEIEIEGAGLAEIQPISLSDPRLRIAWPERIYRVLLPFDGNTMTLRIR